MEDRSGPSSGRSHSFSHPSSQPNASSSSSDDNNLEEANEVAQSSEDEASSVVPAENDRLRQQYLSLGPQQSLLTFLKTDEEKMKLFALKPLAVGDKLLCKVIRFKDGSGKWYPVYHLYIEESNNTKSFLLSARKRKKTKFSQYLIYGCRNPTPSNKSCVLGKVSSNFLGTCFTIHDNGRNPFRENPKKENSPIRKEFGVVLYEPNVLGLKGPRKMTFILPGINQEGDRVECVPTTKEDTLLERYKTNQVDGLLVLKNKLPQFNSVTHAYVLNFTGRVTRGSVKNFQIIHQEDVDYIVLQFGRVSDDAFTLDMQYPISPLQAFGIALSSFDAKLACE